MLKFVTILLVAAMMTGCTSKYKTDAFKAPTEKLETNATPM